MVLWTQAVEFVLRIDPTPAKTCQRSIMGTVCVMCAMLAVRGGTVFDPRKVLPSTSKLTISLGLAHIAVRRGNILTLETVHPRTATPPPRF